MKHKPADSSECSQPVSLFNFYNFYNFFNSYNFSTFRSSHQR